jgi:UDP-3-O-[3-hydroxymyristoyl] glucosamine N-acyltransferase
MTISLTDLAQRLGLDFEGDGSILLGGVCALEEPQANCIGFAESAKVKLPASAPAALICLPDALPDYPHIKSKKPRYDFARVAAIFHPERAVSPGIHHSAAYRPDVQVEEGAEIGPFCSLESSTKIGSGTILQAFVRVGEGSTIGRNCKIMAGVSIGKNCSIGDGVTLDAHTRIGCQSVVGSSSYVGSGTVIDGAKLGTNVIIDNMSSVGKGSILGDHAIVVSKSFLGKNVVLGQYSLVAALSAVLDDVELGNFVQLAGYSVADRSFTEPKQQLAGQPAKDIKSEIRERAIASGANKLLNQRLTGG